MNNKKHKRLKSIVAGTMSVAMLIPVVNTFPVRAMADDIKVYSYDDFDIEYKVVGEWKNHQNILITLTNKSDEPMYNWAFKFDANGKIGEIWGAEQVECIDNEYVIGSVNYNSKIEKSVSFGYILECDDKTIETPEEFKLCTKRIDLTTGYDVKMNVVNEWADSYTGEVSITNTSEEPIVGWNLSFDSINEIATIWNGNLFEPADNNYLITPGDYGYYIDPGKTVKVGFIADKTKDADMQIESFELSAVVRDWTFDESPDFTDTTDTDGDMLPDVYEKHVYGTDPKNADTDGDKLPDGYEVITLRSNPRESDSDNNKVTDDKEDFDSDKLTNYEEFENGTNPLVADTDEDELSDYDEIKVYGTDPLKYDTDDDTVWDSDEVKLGLDPKNKDDGDTPVKQTLAEEDLEINDYNHDFQISMNVTASNYVRAYITQDESPYSGILSDNRSIIGTPIDLEYDAGDIKEGTITFRMNEDTINSATHYFDDYDKGLERYGIFIFDEEVGTIIPVPAKYDEENLTITIDAAIYMGNLMIIDYESLMYDLGIDPRESEEDTPEEEEDTETDIITTIATDEVDTTTSTTTDEKTPDVTDSTTSTTTDEKTSDVTDSTTSTTTDEKTSDVTDSTTSTTTDEKISDVTDSTTSTTTDEKISDVTDPTTTAVESEKAIELTLDEVKLETKLMMAPATMKAPEPARKPTPAWRQVDLVIVIDTTGSMNTSISQVRTNLTNLIDKLRDDNISLYVSIVDFKDITCDEPTVLNNNNGKQFYSSMSDVKSAISGMNATGGGDVPETDIDGLGQAYSLNYRSSASKYLFLITDTTYKNDNNFGLTSLTDIATKLHNKGIMTNIIVPTSYYSTYAPLVSDPEKSKISINSNFCDSMYDIISNCSATSDAVVIGSNLVTGSFVEKLTYGGSGNSDGDGLTDSDEVDWRFVKSLDKDTGDYELFTWEELCNKTKFFVTNPYKSGKYNTLFNTLKDIEVVPALSNPFSADSDGDYYPDDKEDEEDRLVRNNMYINDAALDDSEYNNGKAISEKSSSKYTDGVFKVNNADGPDKTRQTSKYEFTRKTNSTYYFDLTPNYNSFYKFSSDASINQSIKVTYKSWGKTKSVSANSDRTYTLKSGTDYTIKFYAESDYSATYEDCVFSVTQDNWVYAPNGGKWDVTEYSDASIFANHLYSEMLYMPSTRIVSSICELTGGTIVNIDPSGDVESQINSVLINNGMRVTDEELDGAITTIGGATGTTILFFLPIPAGKVTAGRKAVHLIVSTITNIFTYKGTPSAIETIGAYMEQYGFKRAFTDGDANVCAAKYYTQIGGVWDPWSNYPYINRYSIMGDLGTIDVDVTDSEIITWCDWKVE